MSAGPFSEASLCMRETLERQWTALIKRTGIKALSVTTVSETLREGFRQATMLTGKGGCHGLLAGCHGISRLVAMVSLSWSRSPTSCLVVRFISPREYAVTFRTLCAQKQWSCDAGTRQPPCRERSR